jgi:ribosomal protein L27
VPGNIIIRQRGTKVQSARITRSSPRPRAG